MSRAMISGLRGLSTGNSPEDCLLAAVREPKDRAVIGVLGTVFVFNGSFIWSSLG